MGALALAAPVGRDRTVGGGKDLVRARGRRGVEARGLGDARVHARGRRPSGAWGRRCCRRSPGTSRPCSGILSMDDPGVAFDLVSRWRKGHGEALLVVDQFEELFTLNAQEVQARFAAVLGRLAREADVHVLLSLRDDFLMKCADHVPIAKVFESLSPMPALTPEALGRALVEPAKKRGYAFEDEALVDEMVESVEGARGPAAAGVRGVAAVGEAGPREEAAHAGGVRGDRRRGGRARPARGGDAGPHRRRARADRARDLPQPRDVTGHASGGRPRGAAVGLPASARRPRRCCES